MNVKMKFAAFADKVSNSKVFKGIERTTAVLGAGALAFGSVAMPAFASITVPTGAADTVLSGAEGMINAGLPIMLGIAGFKIGMRFLKSCCH